MKIYHIADLQVKNREKNLHKIYQNNLKDILSILSNETKINTDKSPQYLIISGDLFEYALPNDVERTLIYNFLADLTKLSDLKKILIIAGNHDLQKIKKAKTKNIKITELTDASIFDDDNSNVEYYNPIQTITEALNVAIPNNNIEYLKNSCFIPNYFEKGQNLLFYSLEDTICPETPEQIDGNTICLYHGMIKEYVESVKLPIRKEVMLSLLSLNNFPNNSLILAGDIHQNLVYENVEEHKTFIYPGSTQQHTHNEGQFLSSEAITDMGNKYMMVYDISQKENITINKIQLKDYVSYVTIDISNINNIEDVLSFLNISNPNIKKGEIKTYIKIKSTNNFLSNENKIKNIFQGKDYIISFEYNMLRNEIFENDSTKLNKEITETISDIIKENTDDLEIDNSAYQNMETSNINNLVLSNTQVIRMFDSIVSTYIEKYGEDLMELKNVTNKNDVDAIVKDEIHTLFEQQLTNNTPRTKTYNIKLVQIYCNQFMSLGETKIPLLGENNSNNIVRIIGTNGVGKTTLYRMIRWVLKMELFEGMKSNRTNSNNMIIFNKDDKNNDTVSVELIINVNDRDVRIKRTCCRKWKTSTTDADKISINWKDYVSTITKSLEMVFIGNDNTKKTLFDDDAQKYLDIWFDEKTLNTMFLNQTKIDSILKATPDYLNDLVLSNIGLKYLYALEECLESVKDVIINTVKPRMSKLSIETQKSEWQEKLKLLENELSEIENSKNSLENSKKVSESLIESTSNKLMKYGDLRDKIQTLKNNVSDIENKMLLLNYHGQNEFYEFKDVEPISQELKKCVYPENEINNLKLDLSNTNDIKIKYYNDFEIIKDKFLKESECVIEHIEKEKVENISKIENLNIEIKNLTTDYYAFYKEVYDKCFLENQEHKNDVTSNYVMSGKILLENKNRIENLIKSGICPTCNRPLDEYKEHENEYKTELQQINIDIEKNNENILSSLKIDKLGEEKLNSINKTMEFIQKYVHSENNIPEFSHQDKPIQQFIENYSNIMEQISEINKLIEKPLKQIELINSYKLTMASLSLLKDTTLELFQNTESEDHIKLFKIFNYLDNVCEKYTLMRKYMRDFDIPTLINNYFEVKNKMEDIKTKIENVQVDYNARLTQLSNQYQECVNYNNNVQKHNDTLKEENDLITKLNNDLANCKIELESNNEKYNDYILCEQSLQDLKDELKVINQKLLEYITKKSELEYDVRNNNRNIALLDKEYEILIQYKINEFTYKIYNKIIKKDLREVIFEYYRKYLNNVLDNLLNGLNFKLFWNTDSNLYMICITGENELKQITYVPVSQCSGMETIFNGLSLIYTLNIINMHNKVSHIFIDELSGQLSKGDNLPYMSKNYQELFVNIIKRFNQKTLFIIDHNIENMQEDLTYEIYKHGWYSSIKIK